MTFALCPSAPSPFLTAFTSILYVVPGWRDVRVWKVSLSAAWVTVMEPSWIEWDILGGVGYSEGVALGVAG